MKIPGNNADHRLDHLEVILDRMYRRLHHTVVGIMPRIPITGYAVRASNDDILGRHIIPGNAKLVSFDSFVGHLDMDDEGKPIEPTFTIAVKREGKEIISTVVQDSDLKESVPLSIEVESGDMITVRSSDAIADIAYTLLLEFKEDLYSRQDLIIDKLEANAGLV
jgi:hypothetical protein